MDKPQLRQFSEDGDEDALAKVHEDVLRENRRVFDAILGDSACSRGDIIDLVPEWTQDDRAEHLTASSGGKKISALDIAKRTNKKCMVAGVRTKYRVDHRIKP